MSGEQAMDQIVYEQRVVLPYSAQPSPPPWAAPLIMAIPEELKPGTKLVVSISSAVESVAELLRRDEAGVQVSVLRFPESAAPSFEHSVDVQGTYLLKLHQRKRYPYADATVRMVLLIPKPVKGETVEGANEGR